MDLRTTQAPLKERYREDPETARVTLTADGSAADGPISCSVDLGRAIYEAQAHVGVGGAGTAACSGGLLLGALAACAPPTWPMGGTGLELSGESVDAPGGGGLGLRGALGLALGVPRRL